MPPMTDRPIIFSAPMVRAILREIEAPGTGKTQTRRVLKPTAWQRKRWNCDFSICPSAAIVTGFDGRRYIKFEHPGGGPYTAILVPYAPGDRLWVRETWCEVNDIEYGGERWIDYRATPRYDDAHPAGWHEAPDDPGALRWRSPIHMPRRASRITLDVTEVRVQRLQEISGADAIAEGITVSTATGEPLCHPGVGRMDVAWGPDPVEAYADLWDGLHGDGEWALNPWVAAITFRPRLGNIDEVGAS